MKVAIVQDTVSVDGRSRVIAEIIRALASRGWEVMLLSLSSPEHVDEFSREYGLARTDFVHVRVGRVPGLRGQLYKSVLCNVLAARWARSADVAVYSTNSLLFSLRDVRTLHYVHFPIRAELHYNEWFAESSIIYKL